MDDQTTCAKCRTALAIADWTCPRCGAIVDRYLFGTVTLKSLAGEGCKAYWSGYQDCKQRKSETGSAAIQPEAYHPTPRQETPYRAGWQRAADQIEAKADRKFGRRRGIRVLASGILALSLGIGVAYGTDLLTGGHVSLIVVTPIGAGVVGIVTGIVMTITGENDEARPDS
jgi:hypothetical protein